MKLEERVCSMRNFFNEKASGYDEVHAALMDTKHALTRSIPLCAKKILDLGVGTGLELYDLFERIPDAQVTGIDISENMLEKLKTRPFINRVTLLCGNFFELDFGKDYDAVISSSALHHFMPNDKQLLFEKIFRALKPGGCFLNTDCIANTPDEESDALEYYLQNKDREEHIDTPLAWQTEQALLIACGFQNVTFTDLQNPLYKLCIAKK